MKTKVIELLNKAVAEELYAVNQYMYFHFHCDDQGYDILAGLFKKIAIDEMKHLEEFAERILFLKGDVNLVPSSEVKKVTTVKEMLELAKKLEDEAIEDYNKMANECAANNDAVSKKIFEDIIAEEEKHFDQFDIELENLIKFGDNYLALQSIERSKSNIK